MTDTTEKYPRPLYEQEANAVADRQLADIQAHPSYDAVKAMNPHREPSMIELEEHAGGQAFAALPKAAKVAKLLDGVIGRLQHQVKHNAPISQGLVDELQRIRALLG